MDLTHSINASYLVVSDTDYSFIDKKNAKTIKSVYGKLEQYPEKKEWFKEKVSNDDALKEGVKRHKEEYCYLYQEEEEIKDLLEKMLKAEHVEVGVDELIASQSLQNDMLEQIAAKERLASGYSESAKKISELEGQVLALEQDKAVLQAELDAATAQKFGFDEEL